MEALWTGGVPIGGRLGGDERCKPRTTRPPPPPAPAGPRTWSSPPPTRATAPGDRRRDREGERLQKVLARAGVGSPPRLRGHDRGRPDQRERRQVAVQGMRVDPTTDKIAVDGVRIEIRDDRVTYAMNKPPGVITAMSDDRNRPTVGDMVGDLAQGPGPRRPARPGHRGPAAAHHRRRAGPPAGPPVLRGAEDLPRAGAGLGAARPVQAAARRRRAGRRPGHASTRFRVVDTHAGQSVVEVVLHEGRKHIVRRLLAEVGLPVSRLTRTAVGPIELRAMRSGTIRKLSREELGTLQELVGL